MLADRGAEVVGHRRRGGAIMRTPWVFTLPLFAAAPARVRVVNTEHPLYRGGVRVFTPPGHAEHPAEHPEHPGGCSPHKTCTHNKDKDRAERWQSPERGGMSDKMSGESAGGCTSARQSCSDRQYVFGVVPALPILSFPYGTKIKLRMRNAEAHASATKEPIA